MSVAHWFIGFTLPFFILQIRTQFPLNMTQTFPQNPFQIGQQQVFGPPRPLLPANTRERMNTLRNLASVNWSTIDRREEEAWWNLYEFGEMYGDIDISVKPWKDLQIDLEFYFPYYGFRFNYTFIYPEGFIAFDRPQFIQPPYTFPNPKWPNEPDPSFIAALLMAQSFAHVGEHRLSHVWYRIVSRPEYRYRYSQYNRLNQGRPLNVPGLVEDAALLDKIQRDIREGMVGTRGFTPYFALIVTWERMGFGGQPKFLRLDQYGEIRKYLNTYQLILTTDEVRSYVVFNYAHINYTASADAGSVNGRGGLQSGLVGFNGGNGTGFTEMPYSSWGDLYKLVEFSATDTHGRWLARVDELIQYGGCTNSSNGMLQIDGIYANMIGGMVFNCSGPCFRPNDYITMEIDEEIFDCGYTNIVKATCVVPFNAVFKTGFVTIQITQDGRNYAWVRSIYMVLPGFGSGTAINLITTVSEMNPWQHDWHRNDVEMLNITWAAANITTVANAQVDINLWGYWENVIDRDLIKVGSIARGIPNTGRYTFYPRQLQRQFMEPDMWKKFWGGVVEIIVTDHTVKDRGDRRYWSKLVPFGFFFRDVWREQLGADWALELCIEWFEYDGRRANFYQDLEMQMPCPCTLSQALADFGSFVPLPECDMLGDASCFYTRGAQHCVMSTITTVLGATQVCCYDFNGWLIFSQDFEYFTDYLKYASAGVAYRAHPWGGYRYKKPPFVPSWSNFYNDLLPYDVCCRWAGQCEFYYWRRMTSGCQTYQPPKLASVYGYGHFITFDNVKYRFNGRGIFVLAQISVPGKSDLMIQIRMEQPPKTLYDTNVPATVVTGVAASDNGSSVIEVFSRKQFRRWRYRTDVFADGARIFCDRTNKKYQHFNKVALHSPHLNMNMSEINIMFATGVGVKVLEMRGHLQVVVALPASYNETAVNPYAPMSGISSGREKCTSFYRTMGLFGTYNDDPTDDVMTPAPDCNILRPIQNPNVNDRRQLYYDFGLKWTVENVGVDSLFAKNRKPLYYPDLFRQANFEPMFDVNSQQLDNEAFFTSLIVDEKEVAVTCQNVSSCMFDFLVSGGRRDDAIDTLSAEKKFEGFKIRGEQKLKSCGPLQKNEGVIKYPLGNNYLDGVTVTFSCQVEYFLHGAQQRRCINGTWSEGWWAWCRDRREEYGLKWMTGLVVSIGTVSILVVMFMWLNRIRKMREKLEHPDWVAHRKHEQEKRKMEKEQYKEEKRLRQLARKLKKRSQVAPEPIIPHRLEEETTEESSRDSGGFRATRNRLPTVSETVDRSSRSEISLTPDPSLRLPPSVSSSRRSIRQPEPIDYLNGGDFRNRTSSAETARTRQSALSRPSSSDTVYSKPIVHPRRQLPTVYEQPSPTVPTITVQQSSPDYMRRRYETTF